MYISRVGLFRLKAFSLSLGGEGGGGALLGIFIFPPWAERSVGGGGFLLLMLNFFLDFD